MTQRVAEAGFEVGGRSYGVFCHDWRVRPPAAWLGMLADRETSGQMEPPAERPEPLIVMNRTDLERATIDALRDYARYEQLVENPLLRSRVVIDRAPPQAPPEEMVVSLRSVLAEAVDGLAASPRTVKQHRALYHTYLNPAASQEAAAEAVGLPFSTYRRHLAAGRDAVIDRVWHWDLGTPDLEIPDSSSPNISQN